MKAPATSDVFIDLHFPKCGVDLSMGFAKQPARPLPGGEYARTTAIGRNVRTYEAGSQRSRGGQRSGLRRYLPDPVIAGWVIQELTQYVGGESPGGTVQLSNSGRVVLLAAVSQGQVFVANAGDTSWTATVNDTGRDPPLNFSGIMQSTANGQKLWFADGTNWTYYTPATNKVSNWTLSAGTALPTDTDGNAPRLICTWRGRIVLSGLLKDPQNWFMSKVDDPTDFDYAPQSATPTQAVAGNNAPQGLVGDVITTLIPYTDDILIFGGDHSIYLMQGDPMAGGQIDCVSNTIGMAWGIPWCQDPLGNVYFVSNRMGIYTMTPGQPPQRISQGIEQLIADVDTGKTTIRMLWDDRFQGCHVFLSPTEAPAATTHYFYEARTGAWWQDKFASTNFDPLCCTIFDGNGPTDRVSVIGSWDGYVRSIDHAADKDDGRPISSEVVIGPLTTKDLDELLMKDLQAIMGEDSGDVTFAVHVGSTAEKALTSEPVVTGTWSNGRNLSNLIRRSGHAIYVKISATNAWQMETIRCRMAAQGKVRRRGI